MKTNSPKRARISALTLTLGHMWNVKNPKLGRGSHPSLLKQYLTYYNTMNLNTVKLRMVKFGGFYLEFCIAFHNLRGRGRQNEKRTMDADIFDGRIFCHRSILRAR